MSSKLQKQRKLKYNLIFDVDEYKFFKLKSLLFLCLISRGLKLKAFNNYNFIFFYIKTQNEYNDPYYLMLSALDNLIPNITIKESTQFRLRFYIPAIITYKQQLKFVMQWTIRLLKKKKKVFKY